MAFADDTVSFDRGDSSIIGQFREKEFGHLFEYSANPNYGIDAEWDTEWPHIIWVGHGEQRSGRVVKTVAYVITDIHPDGDLMVNNWAIKGHRIYDRPEGA